MKLEQNTPPSPRQWARERRAAADPPLMPHQQSDRYRAIEEKSFVHQTEAETAYLQGFDLGHAYPAHTSDALAGLIDGKNAAKREARP